MRATLTASVLCVGIAGPSCAGKSTLARGIQARFSGRSSHVCEDWYCRDQSHLPRPDRALVNMDRVEAIDHQRLAEDLILLRRGIPVHAPVYEHATRCRLEDVRVVEPAPLVIVDGLLLVVTPIVRSQFDLVIFVDAPLDLCLARRLRRDPVERGISAGEVGEVYERDVRPMAIASVLPTRRFADIIINSEDTQEWDGAPDLAAATIARAMAARSAPHRA